MIFDPNAFSDTYELARGKLLRAAVAAGATHHAHVHPLRGFEGEELATDLLLFGSRSAANILVLQSGTHGVEGFAGSAIQLANVSIAAESACEDLAVLFVHAVNPYGFSFARRGDEDNVDINRNFADFSSSQPPGNPLFGLLAPLLVPETWDEESVIEADRALEKLRFEHGDQAISQAIRRGQHTHAGSVFFGGTRPSWSRRTVEAIATEWLGAAKAVLLLDVHTGLGDFAALQLLTIEPPESAATRQLREAFGPRLRSTIDRSSGAANATGNIFSGYRRLLGMDRFRGIALEFGTCEQSRVQRALRADAWAYLQPASTGLADFKNRSRREMLEVFCPDSTDWQDQVIREGTAALRRAVQLLGSGR